MAQFSLQTYTIRDYLKDKNKLEDALKRVKALGLNALEVARINFTLQEAKQFKVLCDAADIQIGSSQIKYDTIARNLADMVEIHRMWSCNYMAVSVLPFRYLIQKERGLVAFAQELNRLGARLREEGLHLLYHHHHFEFMKYGDRLGIEILMEQTDPQNVGLVIDTYWAQRGGKTPDDFIRQYADRVKVVHLRDYSLKAAMLRIRPADCEIGEGNLSFTKIVEACVSSGVDYMAIEQNSKHPFTSIEQSVQALKMRGLEGLF